MPELPEVEITRRRLLPLVGGRKILGFSTDWPRGLKAVSGQGTAKSAQGVAHDIRGRRILDIGRRGKALFCKLSGKPPRLLAVHLRMSGRFAVHTATRTRRRIRRSADSATGKTTAQSGGSREERWTHFRWRLSGGRELRLIDPRKFGIVWYGAPEDLRRDPYLASLGVDARSLSAGQFLAAFRGRGGRIKPLLLRQDLVAGIGNILADESLWRAGIHPMARAADLDEAALRRLHAGLRRTIRTVLASGGTSLRNWSGPDGRTGGYQEQRLVYGRAGAPCPRCRTELTRTSLGGRGTTYCPQCQHL